MQRARRSQGMTCLRFSLRTGSAARSASVMAEWSFGSLRKYQAHAISHSRLVDPRMKNETRQDTKTSIAATSAGVAAFPIRENAWVIPWAHPQLPTGVQ